MKALVATHVVIARQLVLAASLSQYVAVLYFLDPEQFFVFGVLSIVSVYARNVFDSVLLPITLRYVHNEQRQATYVLHYIVIAAIATLLALDDSLLWLLAITAGYLQLFLNTRYVSYVGTAYVTEKYYQLALCQSAADFISIFFGFGLFWCQGDPYVLATRFVLYPVALGFFLRSFFKRLFYISERFKLPTTLL